MGNRACPRGTTNGMNRHLAVFFWLLLLAAAVPQWGCAPATGRRAAGAEAPAATRSATEEPKAEEQRRPFVPLHPRAFQYYVEGLHYEQLGDAYNAAVRFGRALKFFPESQEIRVSYARALLGLNNIEQAIATLKELQAPDAEAFSLLARAYRMKGDVARARDTYMELLQVDSTNATAYAFLAEFYLRNNNVDSSIWAWERLVRVRPDNFDFRKQLVRLYLSVGKENKARATLWQYLETTGKLAHPDAASLLAEMYRRADQPDSVLSAIQAVLESNPHNPDLYRQLVQSYLAMDSAAPALPYAWKAAVLAPEDPSAQRQLALLYLAVDSLDQADSVITALLASGDSSVGTFYTLGRVAVAREEFPRAREAFEQVVSLVDSVAEGWLNLGLVLRRIGDTTAELETYVTALERVKGEEAWASVAFALGAAYERAGRIEESIQTFEKLLAVAPDNAAALNYLGYMLADRGMRLDYARRLIERAVRLSPNNGAYLDSYGWVFFRLGDYEKALKYLKQAADLQSDPVIFDHLGDAYQALGKVDEARRWWRRALELQPENAKVREKLGQ